MAGSGPDRTRSLTQPSALSTTTVEPGRPPVEVAAGLWLFAPNRHTQGGSSWLLAGDDAAGRPDLLVDAPALTAANLAFLSQRRDRVGADGGLIVLTSRMGHGQIQRLQPQLGWRVLLQEQEAYLLPGFPQLETFSSSCEPAVGLRFPFAGTCP